jgi:hypothetical protein
VGTLTPALVRPRALVRWGHFYCAVVDLPGFGVILLAQLLVFKEWGGPVARSARFRRALCLPGFSLPSRECGAALCAWLPTRSKALRAHNPRRLGDPSVPWLGRGPCYRARCPAAGVAHDQGERAWVPDPVLVSRACPSSDGPVFLFL